MNNPSQELLKREGIQFQVCRNPDVNCSVIERANRTQCDKLHEYFTYKNTYRHIVVLPKLIKGYNDKFHKTTGMAPAKLRDTDIPTIRKMIDKTRRLRQLVAAARFRVGQHGRIRRENMKFSKDGEQNYII